MGKRDIKRIACVQLDTKMPDFASGVIMPRYGLPVIGSILKDAGYDVKVFIEHVCKPDRDWILEADMLVMSSFTGAFNRTTEFVDWVRQRKEMPTLIGGEHASSFSDESLDWFDYVIRGEGDENILELLKAIENGLPIENISGLSYRQGEKTIHNPLTRAPQNINSVYDLSLIHNYPKKTRNPFKKRINIICVQSSRGCPNRCNFCVAPRLFQYDYRIREDEAIIGDIKTKLEYGRDFLFTDNIFGANLKKTEVLLDKMIAENLGKHAEFTTFCRIEIYKYPHILKKMFRAGFRYLLMGLESIDDITLSDYNKKQSVKEMINALTTINDHGLKVSSSFIAGNENDIAETPIRCAEFACEHNIDSMHFISLWYYPGDPNCPFPLQRLIIPSFDYCTGCFVTHFPLKVKPSVLQRAVVDAQRKFWNLKRSFSSLARFDLRHSTLMATIRYAYIPVEKKQLEYANYLESLEYNYYDSKGNLLLDRIMKRPIDPIVARAASNNAVKMDTRILEHPN